MRALVSLLVAACLLSGGAPACLAASLVIEAESGLVLHQEEATRRWYPASLTKMMTAYLVFEAQQRGLLQGGAALTASPRAAAQPPSKLGLAAGARIDLEQALEALVVRSANDVAVVLAEAVAGSEPGFALMMTAKARSLGMTDTQFRNASGLPDPEQVTTARDMAVLARALVRDFPDRYPLFGHRSFRFNGREHAATNRWAAGYAGADGIKTGFTCASGFNLAASAQRDGHRLISILLGAKTSAIRNVITSQLLDQGFERLAGGPAAGPRLEDLVARGGRDLGAPTVLPQSACLASPTPEIAEAPLSGWGVIFGSLRSRAEAEALAKARRGELAAVIEGGRIAVVPKNRDGYIGHSALIVGLSQDDAGRACRHLWTHDAYCLSLAPQVLQNPDALWR